MVRSSHSAELSAHSEEISLRLGGGFEGGKSLDSAAWLSKTLPPMAAHETTDASRVDQRDPTVEGKPGTRRPYEPPKLEPRGRVERTTLLLSGGGGIIP